MPVNAFQHDIPAYGSRPDYSFFKNLSSTIRDIKHVQSVAKRQELVDAIIGQGIPIDADHPIFVYRADAPFGREVEYSADGISWRSIDAYERGPETIPPGLSWPKARIIAHRAGRVVDIRITLETYTFPVGTTTLVSAGGVPEWCRPDIGENAGRGLAYFPGGYSGQLVVSSDGAIILAQQTGAARKDPSGMILFTKNPNAA